MEHRGGRRLASAPDIRVETFHLEARRDALEDLCNEWLNTFVPPEVAEFRPALPLVICSRIFYPSMADRFAFSTGHESQSELYFAVPVERWRVVDGKREFVEYGLVTPYIFVDNAESAVDGRERFGFPKELCSFSRDFDPAEWTTRQSSWVMSAWNPTPTGVALETLLCLAPPRDGGGSPQSMKSFLPESATDPSSFLWAFRQLIGELQNQLAGIREGSVASVSDKLFALARNGLDVTVFNLRQFPHPEYQDVASYQDLIRFTMRITDVHLVGRLAGPYQLLLRRSDTRPINETLGLRNADPFTPTGKTGVDAVPVKVPMIADVDVDLVAVDRLCWRQATGDWKRDDGSAIDPPTDELPRWSDALGPPMGKTFLAEHPGTRVLDAKILALPISATAATNCLAQATPKDFPGRVVPLLSGEHSALRVLVSKARGVDPRTAQELVWLDGSYLSLSIPVRIELEGQSSSALFLLTEFTDNAFIQFALRQLALSPTYMAQISSVGGSWFSSTQPNVNVLHVEAQALEPSVDSAIVAVRPVLDVWMLDPAKGGKTLDAGAPANIDSLWDFCSELQSLASFGSIPRSDVRGKKLSQRLVFADIENYAEFPDARRATDGTNYLVVFHATDIVSHSSISSVFRLSIRHRARIFRRGAGGVSPPWPFVRRTWSSPSTSAGSTFSGRVTPVLPVATGRERTRADPHERGVAGASLWRDRLDEAGSSHAHSIDKAMPLTLGGRRRRRSPRAFATELPGTQVRRIDFGDPAASRSFDGVRVVVNCAGPSSDVALSVVDAAIRARAHYVDVTGERSFVQRLHGTRAAAAASADVVIAPAFAGKGALGDWAASVLASRQRYRERGVRPRVSIAYAHTSEGFVRPSPGSALSAAAEGFLHTREQTPAPLRRSFAFPSPFGRGEALRVPGA